MIKKWKIACFAALVLLSAAGCKQKKTEMPPVSVPVSSVTVKDVPVSQTFVGQIYGQADITLPARASGYLKGMYFKEGSAVRKGQLLYVVEQAPYHAQLMQAKASLANAQSAYTNAKSNYDRMVPLARINAVSQSNLDDATASLKEADAQLKSAQANLKYAEIQYGYTEITSPIDGIIGKTNAKVGDYVGLQSQVPVLNTVSRIDTVNVLFYMPYKTYMDAVQADSSFAFTDLRLVLSDGSEYSHPGTFDFLGRAVDPSTGTIDVQVSFPNPDGRLRPGQYARVSANVGMVKNAMLVPQKCVTERQGVYSVYLLDKDDKVQQVNITVGDTSGTDWIVASGLNPDDRVVVEGFYKIRPGMTVKPLDPQSPDTAKKQQADGKE